MTQLEPREYFPITRQLDDPTDTNTYYVKAFIRNARTDELIDTVELNDLGDQRFAAEWQVPEDPSGEGFYITITTKVYTDSGYSNESPNYAREQNQYLVQKRYNPVLGKGGGWVDYDKVRRIIKEEVEKTKELKVDIKPVVKELEKTKKAVSKIEIPKPERVDYKKIEKKIEEEVEKAIIAIKNIYIPKPEKVDLSGLEYGIEELDRKINVFTGSTDKTLRKMNESMVEKISIGLGEVRKTLIEVVDQLKEDKEREENLRNEIKKLTRWIEQLDDSIKRISFFFVKPKNVSDGGFIENEMGSVKTVKTSKRKLLI